MQYADVFTNSDIDQILSIYLSDPMIAVAVFRNPNIDQINGDKVWLSLVLKGYNSNGPIVLAIE
jgi:hypothetical protein